MRANDEPHALDKDWLAIELERSVDALQRFLADIPEERCAVAPPSAFGFAPLGGWSAHRHLYHLVHYERHYALPALQAAVDGAEVEGTRPSEDGSYDAALPTMALVDELIALRRAQAANVRRATDADLERIAAPWHRPTLWTVAKTIQHTAEHTHDVGSLALFWSYVEGLEGATKHPLSGVASRWLTSFQACVRAHDYATARSMFSRRVVSFGTRAEIARGIDALERDQWRQVWPRIREFTFTLDALACSGDDHGLCVIVPWTSLGEGPSGHVARPGRATLYLVPEGERWIAVHSHFSLMPAPADDQGR